MAYIIDIGGGNGITAQEAQAMLATKQDKLYDSTSTIPTGKSANIKTINNQSLLGSGNVVITPAETQETVEE